MCRVGVNHVVEYIRPLVDRGLQAILLFGVLEETPKDATASAATLPTSPVIQSLQILRKAFPSLLLCTDLCLCAYTSDGHCGILRPDLDVIDNQMTIKRLAEIAVTFARNGAHVIAPSDVMDSRIHAIKTALHQNEFGNCCAVMSYAAKFASAFYGPFRYVLCFWQAGVAGGLMRDCNLEMLRIRRQGRVTERLINCRPHPGA